MSFCALGIVVDIRRRKVLTAYQACCWLVNNGLNSSCTTTGSLPSGSSGGEMYTITLDS